MHLTVSNGSKNNDEEKWFEALYNTHVEGLIRYAYSITEHKALAEDVVSEVFIALWNRKNEIGNIKNIEAYLTRSVKNQAIKKIKQAKKETLGPLDEFKYQHSLDPENILIGKELQGVIDEVMEHLTPHGKLVYDMANNKGYSNEKIAKELGISPFTVRKHLSNVFKRFKTAVKRHYHKDGKESKFGKLILSLLL